MEAGCVQAAGAPLASARPESLALIGLAYGDFVTIRSEERDTLIVRQLQEVKVKGRKAAREFIYLDAESMKFLEVSLKEPLVIERSAFDHNMP